METVEICPGWEIQLSTPVCGMNLTHGPDADSGAVYGVKVHGCMFAYSCQECLREYRRRVQGTYFGHEALQCTQCKHFYRRMDYFKVVRLNRVGK